MCVFFFSPFSSKDKKKKKQFYNPGIKEKVKNVETKFLPSVLPRHFHFHPFTLSAFELQETLTQIFFLSNIVFF